MDQPPQSEGFSQSPLYPEVALAPLAAAPQPKSRVLGRLFLLFLILVLAGSVALNLLLFLAVGLVGLSSAGEEIRIQENSSRKTAPNASKITMAAIKLRSFPSRV